jgi:23S rRNA pseudouridine1911/1915/1917 synthase
MAISEWTVAAEDAGVRLDKFLAAAARLGSRRQASSALQHGKVFLNGDEATPDEGARRLTEGDRVRLWMDRPGSAKRRVTTNRTIANDIRIVYEDDAIVVVDKPAGLLVVPLERKRGSPSVYDILEEHMRSTRRRPLVVHRIDRDTSGLVVFTKNARTQQQLRAQFKAREPERVYLAVVYGRPTPPAGTWRDRLVWDDAALIQKETHPRDPRGKEAISEYRIVETFKTASLVEVRLRTGKRNQIRLQARLRGHTLIGEQRYVFGPDTLRPITFHRQALHAHRLVFRHPADDRVLRFESPLPADLQSLLTELRQTR